MKDAYVFTLPEVLDVSGFDNLRETLLDLASNNEKILLDAKKVIKVTIPCVQLLASFLAKADSNGMRQVVSPSPAFVMAWSSSGLGNLTSQEEV